jgi:hypothetical protein
MQKIIIFFIAFSSILIAQATLPKRLLSIDYFIDYKYPVKLDSNAFILYQNKIFQKAIVFDLFAKDSMNYPKPLFNNQVLIENCEIRSGIMFSKCTFKNKITLYNDEIEGIFMLTFSEFDSLNIFRSLTFNTQSSFNSNNYRDSVFIDSNYFNNPTDFSKTISLKYFNFSNNIIKKSIHFKHSSFAKTDFQYNIFEGFLDISHSVFNDTTSFYQSKFNNQVNFYDCTFKKYLDFKYVSFNGNVHFNNSILPDTLDLRYLENISQILDFTYCKLAATKKKCAIALYGSDINKIKINLELFELAFPKPNDSFNDISSVYERLLLKFQNDGLLEDYQELYIQYNHVKIMHKTGAFFLLSYLGDRFLNVWSRYGFEPERIIIATIIILIIFTIITSLRLNDLLFQHYNINFIKDAIYNKNITTSQKLFYSLIYTAVIFFGFTLKIDELKKLDKWTIYIFFVYIVGLICLLFIARIIIK